MKTLKELITLVENRKYSLIRQKDIAVFNGEIELVAKLEADIIEVDETLQSLKSLNNS